MAEASCRVIEAERRLNGEWEMNMRTNTKLFTRSGLLAGCAALVLAAACSTAPGDSAQGEAAQGEAAASPAMERAEAASAAAPSLAVSSIEMGDPEVLGFDTAKLDEIRAAYEADVESGKLPGAYLLIGRNDKVAFAEGFGVQGPDQTTPMSEETIFRIFSMTKPVVSVTAMKLVEEGKLDIDDPVSKYIPEFANAQILQADGTTKPAENEMLVRHLMSHTAGLIYGFVVPTLPLAKLYAEGGENRTDLSAAEYSSVLAALPLAAEPGTAWNYSRATDVLGGVIEVASGQSLEDAIAQRITGPLGMTDTKFFQDASEAARFAEPKNAALPYYYDYTARTPFMSGGGGLSSTMEDYLRFTLMLANDGTYRGVEIIKPETLARMRVDETSPEIRSKGLFFPGQGMGFGLGFSLVLDDTKQRPGNGTFSWYGIAGTEFWVDPKNDLFMVFGIQDVALTAEYQRKNRDFIYDAFVGD